MYIKDGRRSESNTDTTEIRCSDPLLFIHELLIQTKQVNNNLDLNKWRRVHLIDRPVQPVCRWAVVFLYQKAKIQPPELELYFLMKQW